MELTQLRYFIKIAELGTFTAAGEELLVSQPALSRSIAKLEEELGQPVFERQTRQIELTSAGNMLLSRARSILQAVEDAKAEITDDGKTGQLRVGAIPTIAPYLMPRLLRKFGQLLPSAQLRMQEDVTHKLLAMLSGGEIDVAIMALPVQEKYLSVEALFEEELLLVLPAGHPLEEKAKITSSDIHGEPFVLLNETHCLSDNVLAFCQRRSFQPVSLERASQLTTVQELVTLGHGVSLVPAMAREIDSSKKRVYRSLSGPKPTRTIVMVWNAYRFESKLQLRFRQFLQTECGE